MEKRSIKVRKILIDSIRFWYLLILFAVLGALAGWRSTVAYNKSVDKQIQEAEDEKIKKEEAQNELAQDITETLTFTRSECEKKLSDIAKSEVMEAYAWYQDQANRRAYLNDSQYLQMNPYNFTGLYLEFLVEHGEEVKDETAYNSYIHALKVYVNYYDLAEELVRKYSLDTTVSDISEMIIFNDGGKNFYDDFLMIAVYQSPVTEGLEDKIAELFIDYSRKLAEEYPGYSVKLVGTSKSTYVNTSLISSIEGQRNAIINDQSKIENAQKKFSSMQSAYYNMLVNGTDEESVKVVVEAGVAKKRTANTEEDEIPSKRSIKPMIVLGGVAGVIVAVILIFLANLLSGRLLSGLDMTGIFGIRDMGTILERKKKGIPGMLQHAEYPEAEEPEKLSYMTLSMKQLVEKNELKEVFMVSTRTLSDRAGAAAMEKCLKDEGVKVVILEAFPKDAESAEKLLHSEAVILVEEFHKSRLKEIDRVAQFCRENEVPILGAVGIAR